MPIRLIMILGLLLIAGSALAAHHMATAALPAAEGRAVVDYVTKTSDYRQWAFWPGKGEMYEAKHPHGAFLTTYVSADALRAIEARAGGLPSGALVVKENYTAEKQLEAISVMYKQAGFNPEEGDWFWLKFTPAGIVQKSGKVSGCIVCHAVAEENDWLFTGPVK